MLTTNQASKAIEAAEEKAKELGIKITAFVVDEHGTPLAMKRMDEALVISPKFAYAKAYTSATLRLPTSMLGDYAVPGKPYYGINSLFGGEITSIAGGVPIMDGKKVLGGVGVGGSPDVTQDEECAKAAAQAVSKN